MRSLVLIWIVYNVEVVDGLKKNNQKKEEKMRIKTESDMGSIKIYNKGLSCFFDNGFGDATNIIDIYMREPKTIERQDLNSKFLGHFTVRKNPIYISMYDCGDEPSYEFKKKGRYFVYLIKPLHFYIIYQDDALDS